ncbi:peptidylprolyl isomerase fpr3 [Vermiconidia calcicola]|uniref:Peptidylprolyl isomerase fpr3 n=1 Tax=Vermiconidia calcicola TaxID=1690605 RepID=A0ACC3N447_9PEZI|nr:peptidylprolyl isomerase fpr3 [Vermiconidia calcicola]
MSLLPMAMYGLKVPCGDVAISGKPDIPSAFRITMAAIDPSADPEGDEGAVPRATLKVIRQSLLDDEDYDEEDSDDDDFDREQMEHILAAEASDVSDDDDEAVNGGPSDPAKSKKAKVQKQIAKLLEAASMDVDDDEDEKPNGFNGVAKSAKAKGKMPASDEDEDDEEDSDMDDSEGGEIDEYVVCTLDSSKLYQQPLDITFGEDERVWFKVTGTHSIYLTGNYVEPIGPRQNGMYDPDSDEDEEYDMEPDEDELEMSEEEDELDDMRDPRITEIEEEDEAPTLVKAESKKEAKAAKKNKRPAPDSADEDEAEGGAEGLDEMIAKEAKAAQPTVNGEQKLSKKQLKKLKKNDGAAAAAPAASKAEEKKEVEAPSSTKSDKKVSFAKELEQGPTPTKAADKASTDSKAKATAALGVKTVQGVTIDDKKLGSGQAAKSGDRVGMRYIGKLQSGGKVFDSNKKGKPFSFKLGSGEVIKGWEIGVQGMQAGGERRITIPAHLAYGSKKLPEIPPNSTLVFDIKMLDINKGK